jgi:hypothetical protein
VPGFFSIICFACETSGGQEAVCASLTGVNAATATTLMMAAKNLFIVSLFLYVCWLSTPLR